MNFIEKWDWGEGLWNNSTKQQMSPYHLIQHSLAFLRGSGHLGHIPGAGRGTRVEIEKLMRLPNKKQTNSNQFPLE